MVRVSIQFSQMVEHILAYKGTRKRSLQGLESGHGVQSKCYMTLVLQYHRMKSSIYIQSVQHSLVQALGKDSNN
ncbi:hypothetical protein ABKN59_003305 [Abortiporus biennis]